MYSRVAIIIVVGIGALGATVAIHPRWRETTKPLFQRVLGELKLPLAFDEAIDPSGQGRGGVPQTSSVDRSRDPSSGVPGGDPRAEEILAHAIAMLERCPSFSAKTRQSVHLYGKHLVGSGDYLEQRIDGVHRFRVELKMQVGEELLSLLHVCDGRYLWRCESYQGKGSAERVDLARVARALEARTEPLSPEQLQWRTRLGGLADLLRDLRDHFEFTAVAPTVLADQTPVFRLDGSWRADRLASLSQSDGPPPKSGKSPAARLPEHIPDRVVLFLGRDDLFPFRVEYRRRLESLLPGDTEDRITVAMDLFEVSFNPAVNPSKFAFTPGNLEHTDQTDQFLERLGVARSR